MLQKIAKRIEKEINQARDYCQQAYLIKNKHPETSTLFLTLAGEEIDHAKRLLKEGERLINLKQVLPYEHKDMVVTDTDKDAEMCKHIWEWERRLANEAIAELTYKISMFREVT